MPARVSEIADVLLPRSMRRVDARSKINHILPQILTLSEIDRMCDNRMEMGQLSTYFSLSVWLAQ